MSRILFWLALAFLVLFALRSKWRSMGAPPKQPKQPNRPQRTLPEAETMLCCTHCGIYFPASEAVRANGRDYCSTAHAGLPAP